MLSAGLGHCANNLGLPDNSFGIIRATNAVILGTGFAISSSNIITCAHVVSAQTQSLRFYYQGNTRREPLILEKTLPERDLAILRIDSTNVLTPLPYGDFRRIRPGDAIGYIGWNTQSNSLHGSGTVVSATGVVLNDGVSVDFLEFRGVGRPGYSGGPILNDKHEVIALMRQAWNLRGVNSTNEVLVNRGFSIEPAMLLKEIHYPNNSATNGPGTNTISIRFEPDK
jgi:S1-C subfamily serine protease